MGEPPPRGWGLQELLISGLSRNPVAVQEFPPDSRILGFGDLGTVSKSSPPVDLGTQGLDLGIWGLSPNP